MLVNIEITQLCNLNCKQCYKAEQINTLSYDKLVEIASFLRYSKCRRINISGGEPLLHPEFIKIVELLYEYDFYLKIVTSGVELNDCIVKRLLNLKDRVEIVISLNSTNRNENERLRDGFDYSINAIKLCSNAGMPFAINCVVYRENISDLPSLIEFARKQNARELSLLNYKCINSAAKVSQLKKIDYIKLLRIIESNRDIISIQSCWIDIPNILEIPSENGITVGCTSGYDYFAISSTGKITGCPQSDNEISKEEFVRRINGNYTNAIFENNCEIKECKYYNKCRNCEVVNNCILRSWF